MAKIDTIYIILNVAAVWSCMCVAQRTGVDLLFIKRRVVRSAPQHQMK